MILVKGKAGKGEGGKEVFPFFSLPLSDPPPASSAHSDQRMRGSENQQFGNNCRPKRLSPPSLSLSFSLSLSHCSCIYPLLFSSGMERGRTDRQQNGAASEQACGRCGSQEDFLLHYTPPRSEEGEGEWDGVRIMWPLEGRREGERMRREEGRRENKQAAGKPK